MADAGWCGGPDGPGSNVPADPDVPPGMIRVRIPGLPLRLAAYVLDQLLAMLVASPFVLYAAARLQERYPALVDPAKQSEVSRQLAVPGSPGQLWLLAISVIIGVTAMVLETVCTARWGGSPAKLLLGLRVRGAEGRARWDAALTRATVKQLSFLVGMVPVASFVTTLVWVMDAVSTVRHPQRRSLHDLLGRTLVEVSSS